MYKGPNVFQNLVKLKALCNFVWDATHSRVSWPLGRTSGERVCWPQGERLGNVYVSVSEYNVSSMPRERKTSKLSITFFYCRHLKLPNPSAVNWSGSNMPHEDSKLERMAAAGRVPS